MVIDFHTHTFPAKIAENAIATLSHNSHTIPFSDGTNRGLLETMKRSGVDRSVILPVATSPRQVLRINDTAMQVNETEDKLISFGGIHPDFEGWKEELARCAEAGIKGIKIHPVYQDVNLTDLRFLRILDRCAELGLLVLTHTGEDIGFPGVERCSARMVKQVLDELGDIPLILAHMGGWREWDTAVELLASRRVMIDTAFSFGAFTPLTDGYWKEEDCGMLGEEDAARIIRAFGAERVLFGTDSPWSDVENELRFVRSLALTDEEKALILGGNAERILKTGRVGRHITNE